MYMLVYTCCACAMQVPATRAQSAANQAATPFAQICKSRSHAGLLNTYSAYAMQVLAIDAQFTPDQAATLVV